MSSGNVNLLVPDDERGRTESLIAAICNDIRDLLLAKNRAYGNSALKPIRIFSKADAREQLLVRIDDKLNRIKQGNDSLESDEDVITDLIGYLVLLKVWQHENGGFGSRLWWVYERLPCWFRINGSYRLDSKL